MALSQLNLEPPPSIPPETSRAVEDLPPSAYQIALSALRPGDPAEGFRDEQHVVQLKVVSGGRFPRRGLVYSLLVHAALIFAVVFWPLRSTPPQRPQKRWIVTMIPNDAIFLPALGGGRSGGAAKGGAAKKTDSSRPVSLAAASRPGVTYPGAQPIVSNPPNPTNRVQTILQPALPHPVQLKAFVPLPNVVKLAPSTVRVQPLAENTSRALVPVQEPIVPLRISAPDLLSPIVKPKLPVPIKVASTTVPAETSPKLPQPVPKLKTNENQVSSPEALPFSSSSDPRSLLVLSPIPAPPARAPEIPRGEARGQFAIAPQPDLAMSHIGPGSQAGSTSSAEMGIGQHPTPSSPDATGSTSQTPGVKPGSKFNGGALAGALKPGAGGTAAGGGGTSGSSAGGRGPGVASGSGLGAGSGPGTGAFPGITIQGGEFSGGKFSGAASFQPGATREPGSGSYGITIVSNGNSGGGLRDFGIFTGEQTYTVYVRMETGPADPVPSWILQYALLETNSSFQGALQPPFPLKKVFPEWPAGRTTRYQGGSIVLSGIIDRQGKVLNLRVLQTPDPGLNPALFEALHGWVFRPARVSGQPVALKIVLGVPLGPSR